jgi:hypothetical protein
MMVTMKNVVFRDVTPHGSCKNRHFGRTYRLRHQSEKNQQARNHIGYMLQWLVTANIVPC